MDSVDIVSGDGNLVVDMDKDVLLDLYRQMVIIRRIEESSKELYQQGKIGGFLHLYIGQEAVSTGIVAARLPQDRLITAYRDHGVAINAGLSPEEVMAELLGKATGSSKGKGGSMHLADVDKNFWGGHAIVGAHLPIAVGMAFGDQYQENDGITICMFGDGATNIGFFHEALNLSKVWNTPILWVCENNQFGMGTTINRASAVEEMRQKAEGYNIPNGRVDGMDVLKVHQATAEALAYIRGGNGPYFLEVLTYRYEGHSMGDPERYRESEEVTKWRENDPIGIYRRNLIKMSISTDEDLDQIDDEVELIVKKAVEFAESSPEPAPEELFTDIYAEEI